MPNGIDVIADFVAGNKEAAHTAGPIGQAARGGGLTEGQTEGLAEQAR